MTRPASETPPGAALGVLGGGQLGRMFVHAAQRMGYRCAVLDPDPASPAGLVAERHVRSDYLDAAGLAAIAEHCAAITTEFENVPADALRRLASERFVAPGAASVEVCQDRALEKALFERCGVACAAHAVIDSPAALAAVSSHLLPGILKTARLGYDGKGQAPVADAAELAAAWRALGGVRCVLEERLDLEAEASVVLARSADGAVVAFPVQENLHRGGILALTRAPARAIAAPLQREAVAAARRMAEALGHAGVLCVEFFVLRDGRLLANEIAPRPHNSGHYTLDACDLSQFDLQVRCLVGAPLVTPRQHSAAVMLNLLGDLWFARGAAPQEPRWSEVLALSGACLHLYGKVEARRGRKMGHLTCIAADAAAAEALARAAAARLGIAPWPT